MVNPNVPPNNAPANKTPLQSNFQTNQNFNIDINQIYTDFIQEIDANRSISNLNYFVGNSSFTFTPNAISTLSQKVKIESTAQESRAHCFYRLIGFPVVANGASSSATSSTATGYYNPGLDNNNVGNLTKKITIANHQDPKFYALSLKREGYENNIAANFNVTPASLLSSVLALTSSITTRSFSIPVTNTDPFDYTIASQGYTANSNGIVGINQVSLTQYTDQNGDSVVNEITATPGFNYFYSRYHFIKPFIVDPRIDFSVNPPERRVAVPFVTNKKALLISEGTYVKRPLIEKVIRDRFASTQNAVISTSQQQAIDYILNVPTVKNDNLIQQMVTNIYNQGTTAPVVQFEKFLFIIQAMCTQLVKAQLKIQLMQSRYYYLPLPSAIGPEGGSDVNPPIISSSLPSTLITTADQAVINLTLSQFANTFETQTAPLNGIPDLGGFAFDAFDLTFNSDTTTSLGDNTSTEITTLLKKRNSDLGTANTALQTIEIIMGEWSGLGLCDIVAVMGSLYVMPGHDLLGFLDSDAQNRAIAQGVIQMQTSLAGIEDAQQSFLNTAANFYHLMDDVYQNIAQKNGLNKT